MSKTSTADKSLNDEDLHTLLDSSDLRVPPSLDQAILAQAHKALQDDDPHRRVASPWEPTWPQALSTAAVLFFGVMLVPATMEKFKFNEPNYPSVNTAAHDEIVAESEVSAVGETVAGAGFALRSANSPSTASLKQSSTASAPAGVSAQIAADELLDYRYRETAERWITEVKRLVETDKLDQAREELVLFNQQYPDSALLDELPDTLR